MAFHTSFLALQHQRVQALVLHFERIHVERMQDVPILNKALRVEAIDFVFPEASQASEVVGEGVLITPWFMSLVRLPLYKRAHGQQVSRTFVRQFGVEKFDFIGAYDQTLGYHETCALFSPMWEFPHHEHACETAKAALTEIRQGQAQAQAESERKGGGPQVAPVPPSSASAPLAAAQAVAMPSRRFFLTGRAARGGA